LWVPEGSRANVEQTYFAKEFGFFFRINTGWITPFETTAPVNTTDLFTVPYLDLVYELQNAIEKGKAEVNGQEFGLDDFCYKPISGEGCLVESPMQYWKNNKAAMDASNPKETAQCIPPPDATTRVCFDRIGTPVLTFAVFGGLKCEPGTAGACEACKIDASGMQMTFLLNNNAYSLTTAEEWERQVYIRNFKSFNKAIGKDYHTALDGPMKNITYNQDLIDKVQAVYAQYPDMIPVKADYLAERSIEDNIKLESAQNGVVVVVSYFLMFFYVIMAIGFFPNPIHTKFTLGAVGIIVVLLALFSGMGFTFYGNNELTMISAEVVPFLILAIGVDNMFLISRAERTINPAV